MTKKKATKKKEGEYQKYLKEKKEAPEKKAVGENDPVDRHAEEVEKLRRRNLISRYGQVEFDRREAEAKVLKEKLAARKEK